MNKTQILNRPMFAYLLPQLIAHIALIFSFFIFSLQDWILCLIAYFFIAGLGISVGWHRMQTHKSVTLPKPIKHFFIILGCLGLQGTLLGWVAKHLQHHRHSDSEKDPHSPHLQPWYHMYWRNLLISNNIEGRYIILTLKDSCNLFYHQYHFWINFIYASILCLINPFLILSLWLVPAALGWIATGWGVAAWSHQWGTINYQLNDHSRNNPVIGILGFGEGYQNNHHKFPYKVKLSVSKWEFDPLGYILEKFVKERH